MTVTQAISSSVSGTEKQRKTKTMNDTKELPDISSSTEAAYAIEAILFAAGHPIDEEKLISVLGCTKDLLDEATVLLQQRYSRGGIRFLRLDNFYQLCTDEKYSEYIKTALDLRSGGNLSRASLEVLAIIAYNEPVTRSYIDGIRGVDCNYTVNSLCEKGLIEPCGTLDAPGKPTLWKTTPDFLRVFGLTSTYELPPFELPSGDGQVIIKPWGGKDN